MISIIIPVFNAGKSIEKTIKSVINQTYRDIEIICVDDGSTDDTLDILKTYANQDARIKVFHQKNKGVSGARNRALCEVTGEFIMFLDSDDWIELNTCEIAINKMMENKIDVVMWPYIRECGNQSLPKVIFQQEYYFNEQEIKRKLHRRFVGLYEEELASPETADALCTVWGKLYRREVIIDHKITFYDLNEIGTYEDGLFNLEVFRWVKSALYIPEYLYHYRRDNNLSLSNKYNSKLKVQWNRLFDIILKYIQQNHYGVEYYLALNNRIAFSLIGLGINEYNSSKSVCGRIRELRAIICEQRYCIAIENLNFKYLPIHWKLFFGLANIS